MANLLILSKEIPFPIEKGNTLRVYHSCRQWPKTHTCVLAAFGDMDGNVQALERRRMFKKIHMIPQPTGSKSFKRHWRWSNKNFVKLSTPDYYRDTVMLLKGLIEQHRIDLVITFPAILTEFVEPIRNIGKVSDSCDSLTLTYERLYSYEKDKMPLLEKLVAWLTLQRSKNFEKLLLERHDRIISISPADFNRLKELNPSYSNRLRLIPNGVHAELLEQRSNEPEIENAIVFWGNLEFPPNYTAVQYFYHNVYRPFLSDRNIKWYIVGSSAGADIQAMGEADENIIVTGFVEQLYDFAARIPIMINPMQIGSGLKNKVLEAFALRRMVVSNALGVEAIIGAQPGIHFVQAETPAEYANAIIQYLNNSLERQKIGINARRLVEERYTWDKIGEGWNRVVNEVTSHGMETNFEFEAGRLRA